MPQTLRLGTRGSQLALWQANAVASRLAADGGPPCRIVVIKTSGDQRQDAPLSEIGGKRLFVKEIEDALLRGEIDLAVHSSKDMPAVLPDGLTIAAVLPREDPRDAVVLPVMANGSGLMADGPIGHQRSAMSHPASARDQDERASARLGEAPEARRRQPSAMTSIEELVAHLGQSPSIGTGSVRRVAQLMRLFPGARFTPIRGNLDTRLRKLDEGAHHALVLAAAGLRRLGFASRISLALPASACIPAPGQGIVAIETRTDDGAVRRTMARIDDPAAGAALAAERALVETLGGGCQTPVGALATPADGPGGPGGDVLELVAIVVALDGSRAVRGQGRGARSDAAAIGRRVGEQLIADGAGEILAEARHAQGAVEGIQP
ncbi:MAG TPA: hydroxymethylbilane synthase [Vicinamibacterales bacterium]|nr:hydroxymethylbilane synthase [Vicinamibacterales bacterium]